MKITNVIFENKQYVKTISKIHGSDQLSVMDAYRINRLVKKLHELFEEYFTLKNGIIKKFGTPDKDKQYLIEEKDRKEFNSEWEDLLNIEHDLETEMIAFPSGIKDGYSASDLVILEMFFDLSGFEPEEKTEDELESSIEEST